MSISADLVMELRKRTGAGMMECKKALVEAGDIDAAIEVLRKSGQAKADKKSSAVTAEGVISLMTSADYRCAVMIEFNSQTDFVARDENFVHFANAVTKHALDERINDINQLNASKLSDGRTIDEIRQALIAKMGENISVRRLVFIENTDGVIASYLHGSRIGVLVQMKAGTVEIGKDAAMQIAAMQPIVVRPEDISPEVIAKEKEIYLAQAEQSGKPADVIEKMVIGRIKKFAEEVSLTGQSFVKNQDITVGKHLTDNEAEVKSFIRFAVGEGIEKTTSNFAEEVMAQVNATK